MTAARASLILCAAVSACGPAKSEDVFATFKSMCIDTQADQERAIAAADKAGWLPLPPTLADYPELKIYKGTEKGRSRTTSERAYLLKTANSILDTHPGGHGPVCSLLVSGIVDFDKQAAAFAAVPKHSEGIYLWREERGAHILVHEGDQLASEPLHFLFASHTAANSLLMYGIVSSQN